MRYFLGCDVAKFKIDVSLIDSNGTELWTDKVLNTELKITTLLLTTVSNYPDDELECITESTGTYHLLFADINYALGITCLVYNPIITKQGVKGSIRNKKTDRTDATLIARMGLRGEGRPYVPEVYKLTKYYTRSCQKLGSISCALNLHNTHINNILEGGLSQEANELMTSVRDTIASTRKQLIKDLIKSAQGPIFTRLQTIPGVGPYIAASVIGEIQNMERFKTAHTLTAYVGLDPKIRQSGKALNSTGRLTKRGSSYLRRSIFIAASVARQYDPNMKALYNKKRNEGKGYKVATIVVARKLLTIIRAVWLSEQDYDPLFVDIKNRHES
jgi:transposase